MILLRYVSRLLAECFEIPFGAINVDPTFYSTFPIAQGAYYSFNCTYSLDPEN
jgi:hypothetical protein